VLNRAERIESLKEDGRWEEGQSVFGLPKVAHRKVVTRKAKAAPVVKPEEEGAEAAEGAPEAGAEAAGKATAVESPEAAAEKKTKDKKSKDKK